MSHLRDLNGWIRKYACIYCDYPTNHESRTCPAHRDLAPPLPGLDVPYEHTVKSQADGKRH